MAVTALTRIGLLHGAPDVLRHLQSLGIKLLRRIDSPKKLVENLVRGLDLAYHLMYPWTWHVAIGAGSTHTGTVVVVNGMGVLLIDILFHLVAGDTELHGIGYLHGGIESTPEDNTNNHEEKSCTESTAEYDLARKQAL